MPFCRKSSRPAVNSLGLQKEIRREQIEPGALQHDLQVGRGVAVHIGLDDGVAAVLVPRHAVGGNVGIIPRCVRLQLSNDA